MKLFPLLFLSATALASGWTTKGFDARRTGQSDVAGPAEVGAVTTIRLSEEQAINMPVTISATGMVVTGSWGVIRSFNQADRTLWDKSDGSLFAFDPDLKNVAWENPLQRVPYCYDYQARSDAGFCPAGGAVSWFNGTVDGTAALDPDGNTLYVGRGDGRLYAVALSTGTTLWTYQTYNPEDPADPDGGGEIVGGPLVGPNGTIYFATVGAGPYETNAVYAVNPNGKHKWRYPEESAGVPHAFWAAPALSPHGQTLYVAGAWDLRETPRNDQPGVVLSFDIAAATGNGDDRLQWSFSPINGAEWWTPVVWPLALSVGIDGTLYGAGPMWTVGGGSAVAFALTDDGSGASYAWAKMKDVDRNEGSVVHGLALREDGGQTTRVYVNSGNPYSTAHSYGDGGSLVALEAWDGAKLWEFDPDDIGAHGSMNGIAVGADGLVYTSITGTTDKGRVVALQEDGSVAWQYEAEGLLEWSHPVIGPQGNLYFGESRRCSLATIAPIEDGLCDNVNIHPRLYRIAPPLEVEDTADSGLPPVDTEDTAPPVQPRDTADPKEEDTGCGCTTGTPGAEGALLALLIVARRRQASGCR